MTVLDPTTLDLADLRRQLVGRLEAFGRRVRTHLLVEGAARVLAVVVAFGLLSYGIDRSLRLGLATRLILLTAGLAAIAYQAWRHLVMPARLRMSPVDLAAALDRRHGGGDGANAVVSGGAAGSAAPPLASRVASVLQLPDLLAQNHAPSAAMVRAAVLRSHESLRDARFDDRLDKRRFQTAAAVIAALLLLVLVLAAVSPSSAGLWFKRWFLGSSQSWPQRTYLHVPGLHDGRILVPRGEPAVLLAGVRPGTDEPDSVAVTIRDAAGGKTEGPMTRFAPNDFRHDLPPLLSPITVRLVGADDEFGPFTIEPVDRPRIAALTLTSKHPADAQPKTHGFAGHDADVSFLPQTDLELRFAANVPVGEARLRTAAAKPGGRAIPSADDLRRLDERTFVVRWMHEQPVNLEIELVGRVGGLTSAPTPVTIGLKADQPPRVAIAHSGVRTRVTPQAKLPLTVQSRDDYGLAKVELAIRTEPPPNSGSAEPAGGPTTGPATGPTTGPVTVPTAVAPAGPTAAVTTASTTAPAGPRESAVTLLGPASPTAATEAEHRHTVELTPLGLAPGGLVSVVARATDARYDGPQTSASRTLTFRVVTPEELFREILQRQQAERAKFRRQLDDAQKIRRDLAAAVSEDAVIAAVRQQRLVQREVNRIAGSLGESLTEMKLNALGGQEAYDLMEQKILAPLKALNAELMEPQRDALDRLGKPADPQRLAEAAARQEQIVARMRDVLTQMSQWDSFVDVLNQLNEVIRLQNQVKQATEQLKDKETEGLFK